MRIRRDAPRSEGRRRTAALLGGASVAAGLVLGVLLLTGSEGAAERPSTPPPRAELPVLPVQPVAARPAALRPRHRLPPPVRIAIAALGVRAPIIPLGLNRDHTLQVPRNFAETGYWTGGSRPGERGPAVVVGHVDSRTGPAVFYRLGRLRRGNSIRIRLRGGVLVRFEVQRVAHYSKAKFPTQAVYGPTPRSTLRLITCSGGFDRSTGHYVDNTVVYATRVPRR